MFVFQVYVQRENADATARPDDGPGHAGGQPHLQILPCPLRLRHFMDPLIAAQLLSIIELLFGSLTTCAFLKGETLLMIISYHYHYRLIYFLVRHIDFELCTLNCKDHANWPFCE